LKEGKGGIKRANLGISIVDEHVDDLGQDRDGEANAVWVGGWVSE